jgi:hypothetical protein
MRLERHFYVKEHSEPTASRQLPSDRSLMLGFSAVLFRFSDEPCLLHIQFDSISIELPLNHTEFVLKGGPPLYSRRVHLREYADHGASWSRDRYLGITLPAV